MRPQPDHEDGHAGSGTAVSPWVCAAPNVDEKTVSARDKSATSDTANADEDEDLHLPREVNDDQPDGTASGSADAPPPPIASEAVSDEIKAREELKKQRKRDSRRLAQSKYHLLDHYEYNPDCLGCQAKARNEKHFKGAFDRDNAEYEKVVSMDKVTMADLDGTLGIGGFRYALVVCKLEEDYWDFKPLKTLESTEALCAFREFCLTVMDDIASVLVYCNAHRSLIKVFSEVGTSVKHPPPARPQANAVIERKIGIAIADIRAYLVTGCLPNCFWPFAGHCFAFIEI